MPWLYGDEPSGARSLLSTIAGSMITVAGVTFSITIAREHGLDLRPARRLPCRTSAIHLMRTSPTSPAGSPTSRRVEATYRDVVAALSAPRVGAATVSGPDVLDRRLPLRPRARAR